MKQEKEAAAGRVTSSAAQNHRQPQITTPPRDGKTPFMAKQDRADELGRKLIHSWAEYGITETSDMPDEQFPNITQRKIAQAVRWGVSQGTSGWADVMARGFLDAPDGIRTSFAECCEGAFPPSPEHCGPMVSHLLAFHREFRIREILDRAHRANENGQDITALMEELAGFGENVEAHAFHISRADESTGAVEAMDFVEGVLTDGGASVIYGPSNCGKSFWILDLAASVATGTEFRGDLEVDQGAVVYVALEGVYGTRNRIEALRREGRLPADAPLFFVWDQVSLLEHGHAGKLAASVKRAAARSKLPCRLVILDTLARAMAGGDENHGMDMTAAVASIDRIRAVTGAHVAVVHHCGKDESKGARGHSSLRAAVDTEIECSRSDGESITTVRVTKQRDMQIGEPMPFSLRTVELGTDRRGKPITSCVVHHEDSIMARTPAKTGRKQTFRAEELLDLLPAAGTGDWLSRAEEEFGMSRAKFFDLKKQLELAGKVRKDASRQITRA